MLLPNNKVYILDLSPILALYQGQLNVYFYSVVGDVKFPFTFEDDLRAVMNYFNGRLSDRGLVEYAATTSNVLIENFNVQDEREQLLYTLHQELERRVRVFIPDYQPRDEVYLALERNLIVLLDARRRTYVPDSLLFYTQQANSEPKIDDTEYHWGI